MGRRIRVKAKFVLILFCVSMILGGASAQRLFPVQGPAATQATPPAFIAKLTNIWKQSGRSP